MTIWTCPMHPQIQQPEPGICPICGMALETEAPTLDASPNPELVDFTGRFWVSAALAVPLLILTMGTDLLGLHLVSPPLSPWIQLALAAPIVIWAGAPFFVRGWTSLKTQNLNMFTLISIGVGAAFLYSLIVTLAPGLFPDTFKMHGMVPVYYEAAGVVVALVLLGQVLELRARAATGKAIRALLNLAPKIARRIAADGSETEILLADVIVGDSLLDDPKVMDMIAETDTLITSSRPHALARKGLTEQRLLALNPGLIWVAVTAHGWRGESAWRVGFGDDCAAAGGLIARQSSAPRFIGDALADPLTGLDAAMQVLEALDRGTAGLVDTPLTLTAARYASQIGLH